jgi:cytoskeletal protein RodZ
VGVPSTESTYVGCGMIIGIALASVVSAIVILVLVNHPDVFSKPVEGEEEQEQSTAGEPTEASPPTESTTTPKSAASELVTDQAAEEATEARPKVKVRKVEKVGITCRSCKGTGLKAGWRCPVCHGRGTR